MPKATICLGDLSSLFLTIYRCMVASRRLNSLTRHSLSDIVQKIRIPLSQIHWWKRCDIFKHRDPLFKMLISTQGRGMSKDQPLLELCRAVACYRYLSE